MFGFDEPEALRDERDRERAAHRETRAALSDARAEILRLKTIGGAVSVLESHGGKRVIERPHPGAPTGRLTVTIEGYEAPRRTSGDPIVELLFRKFEQVHGIDLRGHEHAFNEFERAAATVRASTEVSVPLHFRYLTANDKGPIHWRTEIRRLQTHT